MSIHFPSTVGFFKQRFPATENDTFQKSIKLKTPGLLCNVDRENGELQKR